VKPRFTWPGMVMVLLGIPVYWLWRRRGASEPESAPRP
jgi:APA family basic amino acid/polyamine antiporter